MVLAFLLQTNAAAPASAQQADPRQFYFILAVSVSIFYFILIRPMQQQKKQTKKMLDDLQNGNVVTTSGGIVGSIVAIGDDDTLVLRVKPDNIKIQVARSAIVTLVSKESK